MHWLLWIWTNLSGAFFSRCVYPSITFFSKSVDRSLIVQPGGIVHINPKLSICAMKGNKRIFVANQWKKIRLEITHLSYWYEIYIWFFDIYAKHRLTAAIDIFTFKHFGYRSKIVDKNGIRNEKANVALCYFFPLKSFVDLGAAPVCVF